MKISVVTINYNNRAGLRRTLSSLRGQTDRAFELIVIDGASTDGSREEVESFRDVVTTVRSEPDAGIFDAWNKGIAETSGDLIALLNSGDTYHPEVIETVRAAARGCTSPAPRIFCGNTVTVGGGAVRKCYGNRLRRLLWAGIGVVHPAMFMDRAVYDLVGDYRPITIASDTDFVLRSIRAGVRFIPTDMVVLMDTGGISDRQAIHAFAQYSDALVEHGFCAPTFGRILAKAYAAYRTVSLKGG